MNKPWTPLNLPENYVKLALTYRCSNKVESKLAQVVEYRNIGRNYDAIHWNLAIHSILSGEIAAFLKEHAQLIDWGAIAFIVEQAGGIVSDFKGRPIPDFYDFPNRRIPELLCFTRRGTNQRIVRALTKS